MLSHWMYIYIHRCFIEALIRHGKDLGMRLSQPCNVVLQPHWQSTELFFEGLTKKYKDLELIMAILPKKGSGSGYREYM